MTIQEMIETLRTIQAVYKEKYPKVYECFDFAIAAMEKQIAKSKNGAMYYAGECPKCGNFIFADQNFCPKCGQALKWSVMEGSNEY